jgi:hypothetical protein
MHELSNRIESIARAVAIAGAQAERSTMRIQPIEVKVKIDVPLVMEKGEFVAWLSLAAIVGAWCGGVLFGMVFL